MSGKAKMRPKIQIHLSTAIVLMFVAGGLTFANCRYSDDPNFTEFGFPFPAIKPIILLFFAPGRLKDVNTFFSDTTAAFRSPLWISPSHSAF